MGVCAVVWVVVRSFFGWLVWLVGSLFSSVRSFFLSCLSFVGLIFIQLWLVGMVWVGWLAFVVGGLVGWLGSVIRSILLPSHLPLCRFLPSRFVLRFFSSFFLRAFGSFLLSIRFDAHATRGCRDSHSVE